MPKLKDRTALVTGAGSGIGRAIATLFAREGASVAVLDIDAAGAEETVRLAGEAGGTAAFFHCDVTSSPSVEKAFAAVRDRFGPLHAAVNNAGISHVGTIEGTSVEDFDRVFAVNVRGVFHCLKAEVLEMKGRGGAIVNLASTVSLVGIPDRFAYSMSKGAVLTMTYSVAADYLREGIRCNCIAPARIHTPFVDGFIAKNYPGREKEMFDKLSKSQPIGRMGRPEEVAAVALFLCSDDSSFVTGSCYPLDGGFLNLRV